MPTITKETIQKYDVPGPRYTSYPTAPVWTPQVNEATYREKLKAFGQTDKTLSLYIHIPFCQSMCTYCACSVVIRRHDDKYGDEYLEYLFREIDLVAQNISSRKTIRQFHWGGGTPTFLNEDQIERLFRKVQDTFDLVPDAEIAIEIDPRTIDRSKIQKLKELGFNRISMGVQDFSHEVQEEVNRIQSFELVREVNQWCRELNFHSVNFDLIYGLPKQTEETFANTVHKTILLRPDRIALYSFAYVPWLKKHQTKISPNDLPSNDVKLNIFLTARQQFLNDGYQAIAMDHFALASDELAKAFNAGQLYRNFMGYTVKPADEFIGLGVTAIGFLENAFIQNHKKLPEYYRRLDEGYLPVERGKILSRDDQMRQWTIHSLMCHFQVDKKTFNAQFAENFDDYFFEEKTHLQKCVEDQLVSINHGHIQVTELGKIFIRNICMGFDYYLQQQKEQTRFSRTI